MITGIVWVCDKCGSDNVQVEAYAEWNVEEQQWRFDHVDHGDYDFCRDCGDIRPLITRKVNLKDISVAVIKREEANAATVVA
jgi:hypothetical protein